MAKRKNTIHSGAVTGTHLVCILLSFLLSGLSCFSPSGTPHGELIKHSDCKSFLAVQNSMPNSSRTSGEECLEYFYDGLGHLALKHINAGFNCCPGTMSADIFILTSEIIIKEKEASSLCSCNCLYDVDYEFANIKPGLYRISVKGPYQPPDEPPLESVVTLKGPVSGTFCVPRKKYPWGL